MASQYGEMLRQMRRLEVGASLQLGHAVLGAVGKKLEQANAQGMGEAFEQSGLHLVERSFTAAE